jgi:subtilisin family serine protease
VQRRRLLMGLGVTCAVLWAVVAIVVVRRGDGDGSDGTDDEDLVAQLLNDQELELLDQAQPDPACASEPTAAPDDDSLVAVEIVQVDGTCLDATTEYVAEDQVDARLAELDDDPKVVAAAVAAPPPSADQSGGDDRRDDQWALDQLGAEEGSAELPWPDGTGQVVAVLDSGIDADHPDLGDAVVGRRRYPGEGDLDPDGHGTGVAGIIAARRGNGGIVGVTPGVSLLDVPVTLEDVEQNPDSWRVALPWAVNHGADAVNMSLGQPRKDVEEDSLKLAVAVVEFARLNDVVVVASGGNCGGDCDGPRVPGGLPGVVAVGAIQQDRDLAGYSARIDGVDLVAPGGGEVNDRIKTTEPRQRDEDDDYQDFNGTSAAAPHVAALAAAARMAVPEATGDEIAAALIDTANPEGVSEQDRDKVGVGHGLVDIGAAIEELRSTVSSGSPDDLAARTQAAYVSGGTLYAFDGDTGHPVREVGDDHSVQSVVWSDDHATLVGVDDSTLFSWGPGRDLVETECDGCAYNEIAYLTDAAVTDPGDEGRTGDLVVTLADDGTLTRWSATTLESQGTVALGVDSSGDSLATLQGSVGGQLLVHTSGSDDDQDVLWTVDPFSGDGQLSHQVIGDWSSLVAVNAAATRVAYVNGAATDDTCASQEAAIVLDAATLAPVAQPLLPRDLVFRDVFFNGDTLYATAQRIEQDPDGACPTGDMAGLWRANGDRWEQADSTALAAARPMEGLTGEDLIGWLVVTGDEQGYVVPNGVADVEEGQELGSIDFGTYLEGVWSTPTPDEVLMGEDAGGGGDDGPDFGPESVDAAIARYEEFLHALGEEDIDTICEIAGPAAQIAEDEGFGPCEQTFQIVFDMISPEQKAALRTATVDPDQVVRGADEVEIPVEAIVADVTFTEEELGDSTLRLQGDAWYIVE